MTSLSSLSKVYYKQNVLMEPLYNQWYAWSHLIAPANAAMCISNKHLKIMESFVGAPQFHVSACKQPEMMGGPFINLGPDRVPEIRELFENTVREHADLIGLAESIQSAEMMLLNEADGFSLEGMYVRLPRRLRGYVELVYDLNNQPSMRLIEGLLYKSKYYKESSQSIALSLLDDDVRTFVLSTPRLADGRHLHIKTPFSSEQIDELFKMKSEPRPYGWVREALGVEECDDPLFSTFFTEEASTSADRFRGDGVRIRYFGHACLLIESKGTSILTDPVIGYRIENGIQRYSYSDLPARIDYVLITHNHQDHCMLESLLQLRHKVGQVVVPRSVGGSLADPSLRMVLDKVGFNLVSELDEMESIETTDGAITGLPFLGEHADLNIRTKLGYHIELSGKSIMAVADSNNLEPELYRYVHELTSDVDVFFVGMECAGAPLSWIYGPLLTRPIARKADQSRRLDGSNFEKARDIVERFNPKQAYVYAMGQEPWMSHIVAIRYTESSLPIVESDKLVDYCRNRGIESERLTGYKEINLQ